MNDLGGMGINPVTIPKDRGIPQIPNLLDAYYNKVEEERRKKEIEEMRLESLKDYLGERNKKKPKKY